MKERSTEISEASLSPESEEIAFLIAGYVAKKLKERIECKSCEEQLSNSSGCVAERRSYFDLLSRGGLIAPFIALTQYVSNCIAILDITDEIILQHCSNVPARTAALFVLQSQCNTAYFLCDAHFSKVPSYFKKL